MELYDQVMAYTAAEELAKEKLPYRMALAVCMVQRDLREQVRFFLDRERELALEYGQTDGKGRIVTTGTRLKIREDKSPEEYERKHEGLCRTQAPDPERKYRAPRPDQIKPQILMALMSFIEFEEENGT